MEREREREREREIGIYTLYTCIYIYILYVHIIHIYIYIYIYIYMYIHNPSSGRAPGCSLRCATHMSLYIIYKELWANIIYNNFQCRNYITTSYNTYII